MNNPRPDSVVIHYHEIALKGENRPMFVRRLVRNIRDLLTDMQGISIQAPRGRILMRLDKDLPWPELQERLRRVFGVANFSPAYRTAPDLGSIKARLEPLLAAPRFESFRISSRRSDKAFPLTSLELNQQIGRFVQDMKKVRVDLEAPEITIHVELLHRGALIYFEKHPGAGGLPVGVSGHVLSLISGGIDSPVASHHMMKRGCTVGFIHFHSHPLVSKASQEKAIELIRLLTRYQHRSRLFLIPFGEIQRRVILTVPAALRVVLYRRLMMGIAEEVAALDKAKALLTGESLGQVASQTLDNLTVIQAATALPVLRPLIGLDKQEITAKAKEIGTYEISILPDEDCCRLFIPAHPAVSARPSEIEKAERSLDVPGLIKMGLEKIERMEFQFP